MGGLLIGLILIILTYLFLTTLEVDKWFRNFIVLSMIAFELLLTTKFVIDLFTQKIIP